MSAQHTHTHTHTHGCHRVSAVGGDQKELLLSEGTVILHITFALKQDQVYTEITAVTSHFVCVCVCVCRSWGRSL